jgi:putative membrane protein
MRHAILLLAAGAFATLQGGPAFAASRAPTDAEIAAIVVTANQVDIDAGKLAAARAQSADVKALAQRMVIDHTDVNRRAAELAMKLKVTPQPNDTSATLQRDGEANLASLHRLEGSAFDRVYVANEVKYHEAVIAALDGTLIPNAKNPELKALLVAVRPAFDSHLEHAKHVLTQLAAADGR